MMRKSKGHARTVLVERAFLTGHIPVPERSQLNYRSLSIYKTQVLKSITTHLKVTATPHLAGRHRFCRVYV